MENYEPNSSKYKEEKSAANSVEPREKLEKIVSGTAKVKKRNGIRKIFGNLVADDASEIKSYIFRDVIIPSTKKVISDIVDTILFGDSRRGRTNSSKVSYRSYYDRSFDNARYRNEPVRQATSSFDDVILESRGEAEEVLSHMGDLIDTYGIVSVADLYDLVGISCDYTANKYGWSNIGNAEIVRIRDGYVLKMPKALPLK